jgi:hypothetical protein
MERPPILIESSLLLHSGRYLVGYVRPGKIICSIRLNDAEA